MGSFDEFGMMPELVQAMEEMEWYLPRAVQQESIPLILGGGDVLCAAETGSGKTGAFCLPMIQTVWETLQQKVNPEKKKQSLNRARLNKDDADHLFRVSEDGMQCMARHAHQFAGGRGNYGCVRGRYFYEVVPQDDGLVRVGWSAIEAARELGTDRAGFGYGGSAKKSFAKVYDDYGIKFGKNDVVGCLVDRESERTSISFMVNGVPQDTAFAPIPQALAEEALYPAICLKNAHVALNFGSRPWKFPPPAGYKGVHTLAENMGEQERLFDLFIRVKERQEGQGHHALAIIIEPTLELAQQVLDEIAKFTKYITSPELRCALIVGRRDMGSILRELNGGVDIVVGTPGKLVQTLENRQLNLSRIRFFILDEADRLSQDNLDPILKLHNAVMRDQKDRVQTCMFSATLHSQEIDALQKRLCKHPCWIDLKGANFVPDTVHHGVVYVDADKPLVGEVSPMEYTDDLVHESDNLRGNPEMQHSLTTKRTKPEMVARLIDAYRMEQCLIFCRTRLDCDNLKDYLDKRGGGRKFAGKVEKGKENPYSNVCLHSGYRPFERADNLDMFKAGEVRLLICTDVAARGIDVKELPYVINVTLPDKDEDYIHRVGRVGRAERMGLAVSLVGRHKEKVWYHQCPSRGEGCKNTRLLTEGGCCIWYDEPTCMDNIQKRIRETIPEMEADFRHPIHRGLDPKDKVVYGKTKAEAGQGTSEHVLGILGDAEQLFNVEREVQTSFLNCRNLIAGICGVQATGTGAVPTGAPPAPKGLKQFKKK